MRITALLALLLSSPAVIAADARSPDFNRDVRPILSDKCFACHGPDAGSRQAELRLDDEADAHRDRDGGRVLNADEPAASLLLQRILSTDDDRMPPPEFPKPLTSAEIDILRRWVAEGASYAQPWAYVRPVRHEPPAVGDPAWPANWIDHFVLARLDAEGLAPAADADRITLIRRVTFDLTGLPPTPAEVADFLADESPDAWERVVDRLLETQECGERLAAWWFDLVRFADTVGYHGDQDHNISPYRDYVIDAFISDMPFDQFTREQLAGDLLEDSGDEQKIASGYNRLLQTSHEGGVQAKEYLAIYSADHVRNFSDVWLGGTLGCAQCHDHKYDPYTQRDFYALAAVFADIDEEKHLRKGSDTVPTVRLPEMKLLTRRERDRLDAINAELQSLEEQLASGGGSPSSAAEPSGVDSDADAGETEPDPRLARQAELAQEAKDLQRWARKTMVTIAVEPRTIRLLPRGNWMDDSGPVMQPAVPAFLGQARTDGQRVTRLDVADWLFDCETGAGLLTARVFANRFWDLAFGEGLSRSLGDFGGQGEPPSHPELLDRLACEFAESGWSVHHMLKLIVMSRAYRQSSIASPQLLERDPENRLLARQNRYRVPAETVRDTALAVSGLLVRRFGGSSVKPYQPDGYYRNLNFPPREYQPDHDDNQWRRAVYMHWQRQYLHPMLKAFDAPTREECTAKRPRSDTPLASLVLLNDPTFVEAARVLALRIIREGGAEFDTRLDFAFALVLSRSPDGFERDTLAALHQAARDAATSAPDVASRVLSVGDTPPPPAGVPLEDAVAWTAVARVLLNLGETYQRL